MRPCHYHLGIKHHRGTCHAHPGIIKDKVVREGKPCRLEVRSESQQKCSGCAEARKTNARQVMKWNVNCIWKPTSVCGDSEGWDNAQGSGHGFLTTFCSFLYCVLSLSAKVLISARLCLLSPPCDFLGYQFVKAREHSVCQCDLRDIRKGTLILGSNHNSVWGRVS
jgi:hypothetical protein